MPHLCALSFMYDPKKVPKFHCLFFLRKLLKFVRLGEHDLRTTKDGQHQDIPISRAVPHNEYDTVMYSNDIAMLYLERDVEFSGEFQI